MNRPDRYPPYPQLLLQLPQAVAVLQGSATYPTIHGTVSFYQTQRGVLVAARIAGLPAPATPCRQPVFGFHIHSGDSCTGNSEDPFADAGTHYDPMGCPHPYHAGDLPPLFGASGTAFSAFLTDRFRLDEVLEKAVILHAAPDDFSTQPAGNAGVKMACGVIRPVRRGG